MPYIKKELREELEEQINGLADKIARLTDSHPNEETHDFVGVLNYTITTLICKVLRMKFAKLRYWHSPLVRGVLADVADEFYRRVMSPYEDEQIKNNGDVREYKDLL